MDDGRGALTSAALSCGSCSTELPPKSKFCNECGAAVASAREPAEYKQVTVLFADVVDSMEIAGAVGAERLREIMAELVDRATAVVERYGGTVDKFTGDGIMAVFGAPAALEFHAMRACLAALDLQSEIRPAGGRGQRSRRCRPAAAYRAEFGPGDRGRNRLRHGGLHGDRRRSRDGPADGIGGAAGRGDAQRVHRRTGRQPRGAR